MVGGAKDVDLANLEEAARKIALFEEQEEQVIYHGLPEANIRRLALDRRFAQRVNV